jgi:hypothetical protein
MLRPWTFYPFFHFYTRTYIQSVLVRFYFTVQYIKYKRLLPEITKTERSLLSMIIHLSL